MATCTMRILGMTRLTLSNTTMSMVSIARILPIKVKGTGITITMTMM